MLLLLERLPSFLNGIDAPPPYLFEGEFKLAKDTLLYPPPVCLVGVFVGAWLLA